MTKQNLWNHHCLCCGDLFNTPTLNFSCPTCGPGHDTETIALAPEYDGYDIYSPGEWLRVLKLHGLTTYTERELKDFYDDMLDECNPEIKIGSLTYSPSQVFKDCDPLAYRMGFDEYADEDYIEHPYRSGLYLRRDEYEEALNEMDEAA